MNVGVIGYGYWGPNIVRNLAGTEGVTVTVVADLLEDRRAQAARDLPGVRTTKSAEAVIRDPSVDAIAVVTPAAAHFELACSGLEAGKHVLVEKPMTTTSGEAEALIALAQRTDRVLMVDDTFLHTGAVKRVKQLLDNGIIGPVRYIDSTRINLGLVRPDINVLWDLASHDISIAYHVLEERPEAVRAHGLCLTAAGRESLAYLTLLYPSGLTVQITNSWVAPMKVRRMLLGGDHGSIVFDPLQSPGEVRLYPSDGEPRDPELDGGEALAALARAFRDAVRGGTGGGGAEASVDVVRTLEAADRSLARGGELVPVEWGHRSVLERA